MLIFNHPEAGQVVIRETDRPPIRADGHALPFFCDGNYYPSEQAAIDDFYRLCEKSKTETTTMCVFDEDLASERRYD